MGIQYNPFKRSNLYFLTWFRNLKKELKFSDLNSCQPRIICLCKQWSSQKEKTFVFNLLTKRQYFNEGCSQTSYLEKSHRLEYSLIRLDPMVNFQYL